MIGKGRNSQENDLISQDKRKNDDIQPFCAEQSRERRGINKGSDEREHNADDHAQLIRSVRGGKDEERRPAEHRQDRRPQRDAAEKKDEQDVQQRADNGKSDQRCKLKGI